MPTWPASLPQSLNIGASRKAQKGMIRSEPDTGPAKTRRRFTAVSVDYSGDMVLYGSEMQTFLAFHDDELAMGALQFDWTDPVDDSAAKVRIKEYQSEVIGGNEDPARRVWRLSLEIEVLP
ncbi:hypothetical protein R3F64_01195 [Halomonas sp. 5021]|uniref:hypothetical protein n=1 Tax=Halomonas sp. 5021 TaxID=3082156 RepID=UPI002FC77043